MKRPIQAILLVLSGLGLLHISLFTDLCLRYVKEGMRPMLVASGTVLLILGVAEAWSQLRQLRGGRSDEDTPHQDHTHDNHTPDDHAHGDSGHGHDHSAVPRVAWLLLLPALSLLFYAPPALGAYTAARQAPKAVSEQAHFDPLPTASPLPMTLTDFTTRVQQDRKRAIKGRSIQMTGFVTPGKQAGSWYLTRIILTCCAADAQSIKIRIYGGPALPPNTWVSVTGTWHPGGTLGTKSAPVALDARTVKKITRPANGYTDNLPFPAV
ncbi:TIGR03943 family putative permease subunit [Streptomyces sp. HUAS TT20]|uniref:TIGR03943 family putative permease subunit n=1 Tax=Streptomyces sp. HUAS TT20 TaxID=3447509 RepID=UPI0021D8B3E9|nr:TIGR03943 family protein [Streptomyces sp. HUAS 15-9]UXY25627.1 TIGR03943 family protein [Streptomyces sp. HUAS 15-9]